MAHQHIQLKSFGDQALLLEWPAQINRDISQQVLSVHDFILQQKDWNILDSTPAYNSLLIEFDPEKSNRELLEEKLLASISLLSNAPKRGRLWRIPVDYNGEDLSMICQAKNISRDRFIELHTQEEYHVYFLGFLPGFLYLGELAEELHFPRRSTPRPKVPKGSVAIGGQQTGIYPQDSPGGWHIIGHTEFEWFSSKENPPSQIQPGDRIKFISH